MRIVAVADTHTFEADLGPIPEGDVFVHAGDLCRGGRLEELSKVADWLRSLPHRHKVVVAGNHDWCFSDDPKAAIELLGPTIVYLEDAETVIEGVRFWGSPWQPAFNDWAFNLPRGAPLAEKWACIPRATDVLVTHGPPAGIGDQLGDAGRAGCEDLLDVVRRVRPMLHLFGHIHPDGGCWPIDGTCFANVTTWEGLRKPTVLDIDLPKRQVTAITVPLPDPYASVDK
jgi:Icc-related predicted phosphoesterase